MAAGRRMTREERKAAAKALDAGVAPATVVEVVEMARRLSADGVHRRAAGRRQSMVVYQARAHALRLRGRDLASSAGDQPPELRPSGGRSHGTT